MPCMDHQRDWGVTEMRELRAEKEVMRLNAYLCAVLTVLERDELFSNVVAEIDYKEAGFKRLEFLEWWHNHKEEDRRRKEMEREEDEIARTREEALSKLTIAEREILGV